MNSNIPTAEKLLANNFDGLREVINDDDLFFFYKGVVCEFAKEFAKLHVEAALESASQNAESYIIGGLTSKVDKESVLNAYPLTNIK